MSSQVIHSVYGGWVFLTLALVLILVGQALVQRSDAKATAA